MRRSIDTEVVSCADNHDPNEYYRRSVDAANKQAQEGEIRLTRLGEKIKELMDFRNMSYGDICFFINTDQGRTNVFPDDIKNLMTGDIPLDREWATRLYNVFGIKTIFWFNLSGDSDGFFRNGNELARIRNNMGLTRKEFVKIIGIQSPTLGRFESGETELTDERLEDFKKLIKERFGEFDE